MAEHRQIMLLLLEQRPYRQIEVMADCTHRSIARARRILDEQNLTNAAQIGALTSENLDRLFADGRKSVTGEFVPITIEKIVAAMVGRKKPPLKVLWAKYLQSDAPAGVRHYGYDRFCELVAEHVRVNDLTAPITHVPGHTLPDANRSAAGELRLYLSTALQLDRVLLTRNICCSSTAITLLPKPLSTQPKVRLLTFGLSEIQCSRRLSSLSRMLTAPQTV